VEDVFGNNENKVSKLLFNNNCKLIKNANEYIREIRLTRTSSYNTINIIARDLCHFYNFLIVYQIQLDKVDNIVLSKFVKYLTIIDRCQNRYSIENTLLTKLPITKNELNMKIIKIRNFGRLDYKSIYRIIDRVTDYLEFLQLKNQYLFNVDFKVMKSKKAKIKLLNANNINHIPHIIKPITIEKILTNEQIDKINKKAARRNDYERFLYFLLQITGLRIGEALGLKIFNDTYQDIKDISGDITYIDDSWRVSVIWRGENLHDSLVKNQASRNIYIKKSDVFEFELLLEKYLKFRRRVLKNKESQWLFVSNRGTKLKQNTAYVRFKRNLYISCPEIANNITLHSWRHTFCTNELLNGTPVEFVAKIVGHKNSKTTFDIYIHYSGDYMEEIRKKYTNYMQELNKFN